MDGVFCGTPNCGTESVLDLFACSWDSASCWVALPSISVSAFALSYIILFCWICLLSLTGLLFSEGRWMGSGYTGEGKWGRACRSGRRKNCGREVLYERRMKNLFSIRQTDRQTGLLFWYDGNIVTHSVTLKLKQSTTFQSKKSNDNYARLRKRRAT